MSGKGDAEKSIDLSEDAEVFDLQELSRVLQSTREGKDAEGEGSGEPSVGRATDADDECGRGDRILLVSHHLHGIGRAQTLTDGVQIRGVPKDACVTKEDFQVSLQSKLKKRKKKRKKKINNDGMLWTGVRGHQGHVH